MIAELVKLSWYMRGSLQLKDAYDTTYEERKAIGKQIEENFKNTKETGISFI
jgi:hypothetical protein